MENNTEVKLTEAGCTISASQYVAYSILVFVFFIGAYFTVFSFIGLSVNFDFGYGAPLVTPDIYDRGILMGIGIMLFAKLAASNLQSPELRSVDLLGATIFIPGVLISLIAFSLS